MTPAARRTALPAALFLLAVAGALPALANGFVYDDVLVIRDNPLVHGLGESDGLWRSAYWPAGLLYRPLTLQLFAAEWALGGGKPAAFHAVSSLLLGVITILVFRLVRRVLTSTSTASSPSASPALSAPSALAAAALFALHPVHVEAVANVVGQSELLAALFAVLAVERYLAWRAEGALPPARRAALAALTLLGILSKETGYVIPGLLLAAELTLVRRSRKGLADTFLLQAAAVAAMLLLRAGVLGSIAGETPAAVFRALGPGARAVAMLAVVPEWVRLLVWPVRLQAEYGPPGLPLTASLGPSHLLGMVLLLAGFAGLAWSWRRRPAVAFGLLWLAIALFPVSNLAAPSGLVLGERTLFLPSVGFVLLLGAGLAAIRERLQPATRAGRFVAVGAGAALLLLAGAQSWTRSRLWRSQEDFFPTLEREAPRSYRAQFVVSRYYYGERRFAEAESAARRALALYRRDPQVHEQLGQVLRVQRRCTEAIPVLEEGLALAPNGTTLRSRLIECALAAGDTARARAAAAEAVRLGQPEFGATLQRLTPGR